MKDCIQKEGSRERLEKALGIGGVPLSAFSGILCQAVYSNQSV